MPLGPDPERAGAARAGLDALRGVLAAGEEDVLGCLVVTGEPGPQRVLDDWLDQVADTLRALHEVADDVASTLAAAAASPSAAVGPAADTPVPTRAGTDDQEADR